MTKFLWLVSALSLVGVSAHAQQSEPQVDDTQVAMCMVVSSGIYNIANEHQAGVSKQKAQRQLDRDINNLSKRFSDKNFIGFVGDSWKNGLSIIYGMPVQDSAEDKEAFVKAVLDRAFVACLDDLGA
ncbi:MAG: hypothetical protein Q3971_08030 [Moraxella sp.]|nr:hypothetical protein [Moraxella sp.]